MTNVMQTKVTPEFEATFEKYDREDLLVYIQRLQTLVNDRNEGIRHLDEATRLLFEANEELRTDNEAQEEILAFQGEMLNATLTFVDEYDRLDPEPGSRQRTAQIAVEKLGALLETIYDNHTKTGE